MKYLVVSIKGGVPKIGTYSSQNPLGVQVTFKQFVAGKFNNGDTTKSNTLGEVILDADKGIVGVYHSVAPQKPEVIKLMDHSVYSDVYVTKKVNNIFISLDDEELEYYKGKLSR